MPSRPAAPDCGSTLTPLQESILEFERLRWRRPGEKDNAIRTRLGISPTAYYLELSRLIETDAAMAFDPLLVQRLHRRIDQHAAWGAGAGA